jgi:hypothetical protein
MVCACGECRPVADGFWQMHGGGAAARAEGGGAVIGQEDLQRMSPQERLELARAIVTLDGPPPPGRGSARRRAMVLALTIGCCIVLAAWIAVLALTLPRFYRTGGWRGAWVGFDVALLLAFAATGWAAWRRRQVLIICLVVLATLLCCDAWFDVVLDARTAGFGESLLLALVVELPLAGLAILAARRLLRLTSVLMTGQAAGRGPARLRDIPLLGLGPDPRLRDLLVDPVRRQALSAPAAAGDHARAVVSAVVGDHASPVVSPAAGDGARPDYPAVDGDRSRPAGNTGQAGAAARAGCGRRAADAGPGPAGRRLPARAGQAAGRPVSRLLSGRRAQRREPAG